MSDNPPPPHHRPPSTVHVPHLAHAMHKTQPSPHHAEAQAQHLHRRRAAIQATEAGSPGPPHTQANAVSDSETYVGYLEVQSFGSGRYRVLISDISDPNKLGSLMFPAGKPPGVQISWQLEGEGGGAKVDIFDVTLSKLDDLAAMAQPFAREIENSVLESLPPTPEETARRQERDRQEQAAFRAAVMPHLDPVGAVTGAMIVDDFTTWAGVHSTRDGWIVWVGKTPVGIEVSGFGATDLRDDERAQVVRNLEYYFKQGLTAEQAKIQSQVDFQNDLRLVLTQVALAFIAA